MIKNYEQKIAKFKETDEYKENVYGTKVEVENVMQAIDHIKQGNYIRGYTILNTIKRYCYSEAFSILIDEIVSDLMKVEESNNFVFIQYCKGEIKRILNETDNKIMTGYELGMYIAEKVRIPEGKEQQDQLKQAWAEELLEYLEFAYEEGNLEANPFIEQEKFLKNAVSQATKIIIQLSDTCEVNWKVPIDLQNEKQTIIKEINAIKSINFEEIF